MKKVLFAATGLLAASLAAQPAEARENRVVKCKISAARADLGSSGPALVANVPRSMTPISLNAVQWTDKRLERKVVVEGLFARRTEADTVEVTARFVNCTKHPLVLQVRSSFLDQSQFPAEPSSAWKNVFVSPYATGVYQERSIGTDKAAAYLLEMRSGE